MPEAQNTQHRKSFNIPEITADTNVESLRKKDAGFGSAFKSHLSQTAVPVLAYSPKRRNSKTNKFFQFSLLVVVLEF